MKRYGLRQYGPGYYGKKGSKMAYKVIGKGCKKCRGDLYVEQDEDGCCMVCIQCSAIDVEMTRLLQKHLASRKAASSEKTRQRELSGASAY